MSAANTEQAEDIRINLIVEEQDGELYRLLAEKLKAVRKQHRVVVVRQLLYEALTGASVKPVAGGGGGVAGATEPMTAGTDESGRTPGAMSIAAGGGTPARKAKGEAPKPNPPQEPPAPSLSERAQGLADVHISF